MCRWPSGGRAARDRESVERRSVWSVERAQCCDAQTLGAFRLFGWLVLILILLLISPAREQDDDYDYD